MARRQGLWLMMVTILLASISMMSAPAAAHSPAFPGDNFSIDKAWTVHDPEKSWALYCSLPQDQVQYYRMDLLEGQEILLNLIIPVGEGKRGFLPRMALIVPYTYASGELPEEVTMPSGYGHMVFESAIPEEPTFEAFSPGSYYLLSEATVTASAAGLYYVVIWEDENSPGTGGRYGFPVGVREDFTIIEILLLPFSLIDVYLWEGQTIWLIFLPLLIIVAFTFWLVYNKSRSALLRPTPTQVCVVLAGALIAGTGSMVLLQLSMTLTTTKPDNLVLVTMALILVPLAIGAYLIWKGTRSTPIGSRRDRALFIIVGAIGIMVWSGLLIGPLLAMVSAVLPHKRAVKRT